MRKPASIPPAYAEQQTGVFAGISSQDYSAGLRGAGDSTEGYRLTGSATSVASGRVSYYLGLEGPAISVDTACSSSLVAIHLAAGSLLRGECSLALAGGATVLGSPGVFTEFSRQRGLAPDGRCKSFAEGADGTAWAEGVGMLVLERLSEAEANGHHVLATIRGSAVNQDGASNGLTAPNGPSQERVIRQALANAGLEPQEIDMVEAHGTGTSLGDPIEAGAILATYGQDREQPLRLGSLKSNIGHTQAAAGVGGVIKTVLAMGEGTMPKTLHVDSPSSRIDWEAGKVELLTEAREWEAEGRPRRAAVSSFGISGTNAHLVLEQGPDLEEQEAEVDPASPALSGPLAFALSAKDPEALAGQAARLAAHIETHPELALGDLAYSLATSRARLRRGAVLVAESGDGLRSDLNALAQGERPPGAVLAEAASSPALAYLFTGQGSQRPGMGKELYGTYRAYREAFDGACEAIDPLIGRSLKRLVFSKEGSKQAKKLAHTTYAQPALFATQVALGRLYESWGMKPEAMAGHSVGEISAAHLAGVLSLGDAAKLVCSRGALMGALPEGGAMLAIEASESEALELIAGKESELSLAAVNSPSSCVISGAEAAIDACEATWKEQGKRAKRLDVSHAFHSPLMEPMLEEFAELCATLEFNPPQVAVISCLKAEPLTREQAADPAYWVSHARQAVRFADVIATLLGQGTTAALELGPDPVLCTMASECLDDEAELALAPALRQGYPEPHSALGALGAAHVDGASIDWEAFFAGSGAKRVPLPTYAFQRERYWLSRQEDASEPRVGPAGSLYRLAWEALSVSGEEPDPEAEGESLREAEIWRAPKGAGAKEASLALLAKLQGFLAEGEEEEARLAIVVEGAFATDSEESPDPAQAALAGLAGSAASEHPGRICLIDSDGSDASEAALKGALSNPESKFALREGRLLAPRLVEGEENEGEPRELDPDRTALVTGATGGLGQLIARHLVESHGVGHLLLASRSGEEAAGARELREELEGLGAQVGIAACDVSAHSQVEELLAGIDPEHPLGAVVHCAAVLDDATVQGATAEQVERVFAPKADGAQHLHELTREADLTHFICFSSVAGLFGFLGQGVYAAANRYLDALAQARRIEGLPATAIAWGLWQRESGMAAGLGEADVARMGRDGVAPLSDERGLELFDRALAASEPLGAAMALDLEALRAKARAGTLPALLAGIVPQGRAAAPAAARLAALPEREREQKLRDLVRAEVAAVLGHGSADEVPSGRSFKELGFDSLAAVELRNRLKEATGLRLASTTVFDYPTAAGLAAHLAERLSGAAVPAKSVASRARSTDDPIAIIGMACRLPGASSPGELWQLLGTEADATSEFPTDRGWERERLFDPDPDSAEKTYTWRGGFLAEAGHFDAEFFGISPREAIAMDPQQRLLLEAAWEACEEAGIDPARLRGEQTGVFAGISSQDYSAGLRGAGDSTEGYRLTGSATSVASGRVSYFLGLEGPAISVDTACSSSLVAIHLAAGSLLRGECSLALAGGATVLGSPGVFTEFSRQRGLAPDGRCKSFAEGADGTAWAEGVGMLVLERLSEAEANGHHVLATIRGSAVNQDGASNGLTAPNGPSQERVIRQALANAGLEPQEIDMVEAHGTGTSLGDPIEAGAILATYGQDREQPLRLGSLKSNIGHTQAAAGVGGVIKTVLAMGEGTMPKTLHVDSPSSRIDWEAGKVELLTEAREWEAEGRPRRAGISAFGMSGTNAHLILEEAPVAGRDPGPGTSSKDRDGEELASPAGPSPLLLAARGSEALAAQALRLAAHIEGHPELGLADLAYSLATTRAQHEHRAGVVAAEREAALAGLRAIAAGGGHPGVFTGTAKDQHSLAYLFTGQGSQRPGMGKELYETYPAYREAFDGACEAIDPLIGRSLKRLVFSKEGSKQAKKLAHTTYAQPALFATQVALGRLYESWGLVPEAMAGHSVGEISAAHLAGVLSLGDAAKLVCSRGALMGALPEGGAMLAIEATEREALDLIAGKDAELSLAAINSPSSCVISGAEAAIDACEATWKEQGKRAKRLDVSHAFHSPLMEPMLEEFAELCEGLEFKTPELPIVSCLSGELLTEEQATDPSYWVTHVRQPVRFAAAIETLLGEGTTTALELGPDPVLCAMADECLGEGQELTLAPALRSGHPEPGSALGALATAHATGTPIDWEAFFAGSGAKAVPLPTYPFQRQRYWLSPQGKGADATALGQGALSHPFLSAAIEEPLYLLEWQAIPALTGESNSATQIEDFRPGHLSAGLSDAGECAQAICARALERIQDFLVKAGEDSRLAILTEGAFAVDPGEAPDPAQAALAGLVGSAASEHPGRICLVDTDGSQASEAVLEQALASSEPQLALRDGEGLVGRLVEADPGEGEAAQLDPSRTILITGATGGLGQADRTAPG